MTTQILNFTKKRVTLDENHTPFKAWEISLDGKFICFIDNDTTLQEFQAFQTMDSDFICGGLTLTECLESLTRAIEQKSITLIERPKI